SRRWRWPSLPPCWPRWERPGWWSGQPASWRRCSSSSTARSAVPRGQCRERGRSRPSPRRAEARRRERSRDGGGHGMTETELKEEAAAVPAADVLLQLGQVIDPELGIDIVNLGMVYEVAVRGAEVRVE